MLPEYKDKLNTNPGGATGNQKAIFTKLTTSQEQCYPIQVALTAGG